MNNHLVEDNMKLVYYIVSREYPTYIGDEDIVQCGMVGLCKAANTWDESKSEFSTYACKCITNEIRKEFSNRKKHSGVLSLDYPSKNDECENTTFGDYIMGDEDVPFADLDSFYATLTKDEREILAIDSMGYSPDEIAECCGCNLQKVWKTLRIIDNKRRNFYGN